MTRYLVYALLCLAAAGEQLPVRIFTTADGLAGNFIDRIVRDSRGYLWFCTRDGLSRFDGYQFRNFAELRGLRISDMIETGEGDYWVATNRGVARFRPAESNPGFEIYSATEDKFIQTLAADPAGGLWVGAAIGLYHLDPPHPPESAQWRFRPVDIGIVNATSDDRSVEALLVDHTGTLWVGARSGLYRRFRDGRHEGTQGGLPYRNITALLEDRERRLWAGTWNGVCQIQPDRGLTGRRPQDVCVGFPEQAGTVVNSLRQSADGTMWLGADGALLARSPVDGRWTRYTSQNGLPGHGTPLLSIGEDSAGNLWVSGYGALRIAKGGLRTYLEQDGLDSNMIVSILEDRAGELCVITQSPRGRLINRFDGTRFHAVRPAVPRMRDLGWGVGQIAVHARNGEWWIPTSWGVFRFPSVPADRLGKTAPRSVYEAENSIYIIFEDSRGGIWISIEVRAGPDGPTRASGLARWDPVTGAWSHYSEAEGVASTDFATAFAEDRMGTVWVGLSTGWLLRYADGRFEKVLPVDGKRVWVRSLHVDRGGHLWMASSAGVTRFDLGATPRNVVRIGVADGLSSEDVLCLTEDRQGRIYAGTGHGVDRISPGPPLRIKHYTIAEGLARGGMRAAFADRNGALWFGTREGLSRLEPEPDSTSAPPPVLITGLRVRGATRPVSALGERELRGMELAPDQNQVELDFASLRFGAGETLRYQYRLEGRDADWSPPSETRSVAYGSLAPGSYIWQVRAITADGVASQPPATLSFTILPPVWQRWWMKLLVSLAACATLYALYRYRIERLLEMERLRTRIATDLHDDIGSTLSQIAILSEVARRHPGASDHEPLSDIADLSRGLVDSMSDIVWAIDPDQDRLDDLSHRMRRFAGDLFGQNGVMVRFHAQEWKRTPQVGIDIRRQVFLVFKESLHNAARHADCSLVEIRLQCEDGWLKLRVTDDGKGFDPEKVSRGHGLESMAQRAAQLGGSLAVDSRPECGTTVELRVPLDARLSEKIPHKWVGWLPRLRSILKSTSRAEGRHRRGSAQDS